MELHHSKHHEAYVDGANAAARPSWPRRARRTTTPPVNGLEKNLAFHLGGHINHSVFWKNMCPDGGDKPDGELAAAIDEFFGSLRRVPGALQRATPTRSRAPAGRSSPGTPSASG